MYYDNDRDNIAIAGFIGVILLILMIVGIGCWAGSCENNIQNEASVIQVQVIQKDITTNKGYEYSRGLYTTETHYFVTLYYPNKTQKTIEVTEAQFNEFQINKIYNISSYTDYTFGNDVIREIEEISIE